MPAQHVQRTGPAVLVDRVSAAVVKEWDALADRTNTPPWLRAGWLEIWARAFGAGDLGIIALRTDDRILALLSFIRRRGAFMSPTNWHTPDFRLIAEDDDARRSLAAAVFAAGPRRVQLGFLSAHEQDVGVVGSAAEQAGYRVLVRELERSPYVPTVGEFEVYERSLDRHFLTEARRRRRRLDEAGALTIDVVDGRERLDELLDEGFRVEAAGWKGAAGTAIASSEDTRRFYRELAHWAAARGWLRLAFLRLDGRPLAFQYLIEYGNVLSQLKGGYDESFKKFAPGTLLTYELIARAFASTTTSYEFLGGDEAFKLDWTEKTRERLLLQAFAPTLAGRVDRAAFVYGRPAAKRASDLVRR